MTSTTENQSDVLIVGAGLVGALLAARLGKAGYRVEVFEARDDLRVSKVAAGRSINLALSYRGLCALEEVGLAGDVLEQAIPMRGRMIHAVNGATHFQPYGTESHHVIHSVSRAGLNMTLLDAASATNQVKLEFRKRCVDVDFDAGQVGFEDPSTNERFSASGAMIVGADGAFSAIRRRMQSRDRFNYRQDYLAHGYKELTIPPGSDRQHRMDKNALHIWPRKSFMMIALPNPDGSFTCTLFFALEGAISFAALRDENDVRCFFERTFPDAVPLMPTLVDDFVRNPTSSLVTIRCSPWYVHDKTVLIGDACHGVVPFYGQGMNAGFEDVIVLADCMERHRTDHELAFEEYYRARKPNTDALADLALGNFIEMRDHTGKRRFLWKKKFEHTLHRALPGWFVPLYTMVTFTRTPYAEAVDRARRQEQVAIEVAVGVLLIFVFLVAWLM
ncbi:MAG: NAD(P)/FAD-dependent oxidoreductase [Planctomycetota bacterium]